MKKLACDARHLLAQKKLAKEERKRSVEAKSRERVREGNFVTGKRARQAGSADILSAMSETSANRANRERRLLKRFRELRSRLQAGCLHSQPRSKLIPLGFLNCCLLPVLVYGYIHNFGFRDAHAFGSLSCSFRLNNHPHCY